MPATVEGAFVLVDRASDKLDRIRRRAERTDKALESMGNRLDQIGGNRHVRQLEQTDRALTNLERGATRTSRSTDRLSGGFRKLDRDARGLKGRLAELGAALKGLSALMKPGVYAGVGIALGVALQAVNALAAGVVALVPKITDLGGALAAVPATVAGIGLAVGAAKLAFSGLGKAMSGNKKALAQLTPEARKFVQTLKGAQPLIKDLRRSAQQGMFPGLDAAVKQLRVAAPMMNRLMRAAGQRVGGAASDWARFLTGRGMRRDLEAMGNQGLRIFSRISKGAQNLFHAIVDISRAAAPFTEWLTRTLLGFTKWIRETTHANRENGKLTRFFERTRKAMEQFGRIGRNLFVVIRNIGRASRPLGDDLYASFEKTTKRWADWTKSLKGQSELALWFRQARDPLHELFGLVGDLGKAIVSVRMSPLTESIKALRDIVPDLQKGFDALSGFGPTLASAISTIAKLLANLLAGAGPLTLLLKAFTNILSVINQIIEKIPAFGALLSAGVVMVGLSKLRASLVGVARSWGLIASEANAAATAEARAAGVVPVGPTGGGGAPVGGGARGRGGRGGLGGIYTDWRERGAARTVLAGGGGMGPAAMAARDTARARLAQPTRLGAMRANSTYGLARSFGRGRAASGLAQSGAMLMGGAGLARLGLGAAARFLWPLAAIGGLLGAAQGTGGRGLGGLAQNTLSGASFGLLKSTGAQDQQNAEKESKYANRELGDVNKILGRHGGDSPTSIKQLRDQARILGVQVAARKGETGAEKELSDVLQQQLDQRREMLNVALREQHLRDAERAKERAGQLSRGYAKAYGVYTKAGQGPAEAFGRVQRDMLAKLSQMRGPGGRLMAQNVLSWAQELAKKNPAMQGAVNDMTAAIKAKFRAMGQYVQIVNGRILTGSATEWSNIKTAIAQPAEEAAQRVHKAFTAIQQEAVGSLMAMGFSKGQATTVIRGVEAGTQSMPGSRKGLSARGEMAMGARGQAMAKAYGGKGDGLGAIGGLAPEDRASRAGAMARNAQTAATVGASGGGGGLMGAKPGLGIYAQDASGYGLHVSSGLRPGAITSSGNKSYHSSGDALDLAGPASNMMAFARHAAQAYGPHLEELIHTPLGKGQIKNGQPFVYSGQVAADHFDHVHIADTAPSGAVGAGGMIAPGGAAGALMQMPNLKAPVIGVGGVAGTLGQLASNAMAAGLTQKINGALGAGGVLPGGGAVTAGGQYSKSQLADLWVSQGGSPAVASLMAAIALAESGGNPSAHNPSGASGLWQILGNPFPGNPMDPSTNARMAVSKYGSQGLRAWEAYTNGNYQRYMGDGLGFGGWFGQGGQIAASRPTLIGIGDGAGTEVATVKRKGARGSGGVTVHIGTIENHRAGDIREHIKREVSQAFTELAAELDGLGMENEQEIMA